MIWENDGCGTVKCICTRCHIMQVSIYILGFPGGSGIKNQSASAGDASSIPKSGRSPGEENGSPFSILAWGIPRRNQVGCSPWGRKASSDLASKQQYLWFTKHSQKHWPKELAQELRKRRYCHPFQMRKQDQRVSKLLNKWQSRVSNWHSQLSPRGSPIQCNVHKFWH